MAQELSAWFSAERPSFFNPAEEGALVREARARSPEAWALIYDEFYPKIFRYMRARVATVELAEDLAANVFVEAINGIDGYSPRGKPLLAWLYGIARNVANYHHRSTARRSRIEEKLQSEPLETDAPESFVESWDVRIALTSISPDQRDVLILRYFAGLSTPEVAAALGKHERAVYSLHARGIQSLRKRMSPGISGKFSREREVSALSGNRHCESNERTQP